MTQKHTITLKGFAFALALCLLLGLMIMAVAGVPAEVGNPLGCALGVVLFITLINIDTNAGHRKAQN